LQRFIIRRLLYMVLMLGAMTVFIFGMSRAAGDPRLLYLREDTTQEEWDAWGREMGLDRPIAVQYLATGTVTVLSRGRQE
jgi:ABC-type dipeptide/oligopeptide/nickel transport system permease component